MGIAGQHGGAVRLRFWPAGQAAAKPLAMEDDEDQPDPMFETREAARGIAVRILDLSGANGSEPVEEIRGFGSLGHANTFARRYVRDSVERCRGPGMAPPQVLEAWFAFGEDAEVIGAAEGAWSSKTELKDFSERPLREGEQRDWRAMDPRRAQDEEEA